MISKSDSYSDSFTFVNKIAFYVDALSGLQPIYRSLPLEPVTSHKASVSESTSDRESPVAYGRAIFNRRGAIDSANPSGLTINGCRKLIRFAISLSIWLVEIESERD
jgi:hypothetical protein